MVTPDNSMKCKNFKSGQDKSDIHGWVLIIYFEDSLPGTPPSARHFSRSTATFRDFQMERSS